MTRIRAAYAAFTDPESQARDMPREARLDLYAQCWSYYRNLQFSTRAGYDWSAYLTSRGLYKHTRLIYNPVPNIVDFYVDNVWQPADNEQFRSLVTPLEGGTGEELIEVVSQLDQWSNFQAEGVKIKRYAAATGNVLVEGIDDLERGKILHRTVWPGYVYDLELNSTGDVQSYILEYDVYDRERKATYRYRKVVTKDTFAYFRDDKPFVPDGKLSAVEDNPYGFCFAVWIRHTDDGADFGSPAVQSLDKVDEINSLGSHLHDNIHKTVESPLVVSTDGEVLPLIGATRNVDGTLADQDPRLNWMVLKTKAGASVLDLASKLKLEEAHPYLKELLQSFTDDYPELQAAAIIRKHSQLSGAALERMLGPAQNRLDGVQANYNQQLIKLRQMQIAVGGMRANGGGWSRLTDQQAAFRPFNLNSYESGKLNFNLERAVLVRPTEQEDEELLKLKAERANTLKEVVDPREQLKIAGYSEEQTDEILQRKAAEPPKPAVIPEGLPENRQLPEVVN